MDNVIKRVSLPKLEVPVVYNVARDNKVGALDIIAYVRSVVDPNPWTAIVIETNATPIAVEELEKVLIFYDKVNDKKAQGFVSLSSEMPLVISCADLNLESEDCGLLAYADELADRFSIRSFSIAITCDQNNKDQVAICEKLYRYACETNLNYVDFPYFILQKIQLFESGLDIAEYANKIDMLNDFNKLNAPMLKEILDDLDSHIDPERTIIQALDPRRTPTVRLLSVYCTLKYRIPPLYVSSYISDYIESKYLHPMDKLSFYERIQFLRKIPPVIGYIGCSQSFNCIGKVVEKIFPYPHAVYNMTDGVIVESPESFDLSDPALHLIDYRSEFPGSQQPLDLVTDVKGIVQYEENDVKTDTKLCELFVHLASITPGSIYGISIKNSLLAEKDGKRYLIFCPEECGLKVMLVSEYIGSLVYVIPEHEFYRIIDAQVEQAILRKNRATTYASDSKALATTWRNMDHRFELQAALPLDVWLYMSLLPYRKNGLSYYDKNLRCSKNVLPILRSEDTKYEDISPVCRYFPEAPLRGVDSGLIAINSFGTIANYKEKSSTINLTYRAFIREALL